MTFDEKLELMRDAYESGIEDAKKNYEHEPINWKGVGVDVLDRYIEGYYDQMFRHWREANKN